MQTTTTSTDNTTNPRSKNTDDRIDQNYWVDVDPDDMGGMSGFMISRTGNMMLP